MVEESSLPDELPELMDSDVMPYGLARFLSRLAAVVEYVSEKPLDFSMAFKSLSVSMSFAIIASFSIDSFAEAVTRVGTVEAVNELVIEVAGSTLLELFSVEDA